MSFEYKGLHLTVDAIVKDGKKLTNPEIGVKSLEKIVERIDMTMILPPVTVKFPHVICEMQRVLNNLEGEGLGESKTAKELKSRLKERREESYGYSTFLMIAESHISIHTFPELNYFSFDCYSCKHFDIQKVIQCLEEDFEVEKIEVQSLNRRIPEC